MRRLLGQFGRFGAIGTVGLVVDFGIFNLLLNTVFAPETVAGGPLYAKLTSASVAILANWLGNRYWTFREHRGRQLWREAFQFALVSVGGMLIGLGALWVSHYLLGFTSRLADNVASNVVGLALGTAFRFLLYRHWVFRPRAGEERMFVAPPTLRQPSRGPRPVTDPAD